MGAMEWGSMMNLKFFFQYAELELGAPEGGEV